MCSMSSMTAISSSCNQANRSKEGKAVSCLTSIAARHYDRGFRTRVLAAYFLVGLHRLLQILDLPIGVLCYKFADLTLDVLDVAFNRFCRGLGWVKLCKSARKCTCQEQCIEHHRSRHGNGCSVASPPSFHKQIFLKRFASPFELACKLLVVLFAFGTLCG